MKKILAGVLATVCVAGNMAVNAQEVQSWAKKGVSYCVSNGIMEGDNNGNLNLESNITRAEMAKMISVACKLKEVKRKPIYMDVEAGAWYYSYVARLQDYIPKLTGDFKPNDYATREDFISNVIYASNVNTMVAEDAITWFFEDANEVSVENYEALNAAVFYGYVVGDNQKIRPKDYLTRAEACVFLERILSREQPKYIPFESLEAEYYYWLGENAKTDVDYSKIYASQIPLKTEMPVDVFTSKTPIKGESEKTMEQAVSWAKRNGAADIFIDVAPLYWKYGEIFGIRADVMYAQAAKETGFGHYTGKVTPEMNNWAGIKKYGATGDATEDHEVFETPDDGVRGHFNHMAAYVGVEPVGEPHGRYRSVKSLTWAGTVEFVEQLGKKWCPDPTYGYSILKDYVDKM